MVGQKVRALMLYFFALVQELIDRPSYINEQLLEHDAYISCLQLKKVNVAHDAMHNNHLYNHTAYYHVLQQVIAFLVKCILSSFLIYLGHIWVNIRLLIYCLVETRNYTYVFSGFHCHFIQGH